MILTSTHPQASPAAGERLDHRPQPDSLLTVQLLSFRATVSSRDPKLMRALSRLYGPALVQGEAPNSSTRYVVEPVVFERRWYLLTDGDGFAGIFRTVDETLAYLEYLIAAAAAASLDQHVLIHAGVVRSSAGSIILPGPSGAGKSTLVAALCLSGLDYFSDELAVLELPSGDLLPFLKPIGLKAGGRQVIQEMFLKLPPLVRTARLDGIDVHYLTATRTAGPADRAVPRYVLVPERREGASAALEPLTPAQTLVELARHSMNLPRHGRSGLHALVDLVERAESYRLRYDDLRQAVALVGELLAGARRPATALGAAELRALQGERSLHA